MHLALPWLRRSQSLPGQDCGELEPSPTVASMVHGLTGPGVTWGPGPGAGWEDSWESGQGQSWLGVPSAPQQKLAKAFMAVF